MVFDFFELIWIGKERDGNWRIKGGNAIVLGLFFFFFEKEQELQWWFD